MSTVVKSQKFSTLFDWFDQDNDGQLTQDDLKATAQVFSRAAAEDDHANITAIHDAFEQWWQLLLKHGDSDGDGQVSRQEFITVMEANVTTPEHFESAVMAIADAVMNALDTNGDGVLSQDEYVHLYDTLGVPKELSAQAFHRLDLDGDGVISFGEYRTAIVEFYLSADPQAAGNYLLGPATASL
ncbi:EF-hand domain-containing protein [Streptomyces virginiae]|uniref:EF-hand domain-containing protein n=1 Tax=Streptomyces virginiae TaxID=1961 RepID=UPI00368213EB